MTGRESGFFVNPAMIDPFRTWLRDVFAMSSMSGQALFRRCLAAGQDRYFVDSHEPDQILRGAEGAGWVSRARNAAGMYTVEPLLIQRVGGVGGGAYDEKRAKRGEYWHHGHMYGWEPVRSNEDAQAFVRGELFAFRSPEGRAVREREAAERAIVATSTEGGSSAALRVQQEPLLAALAAVRGRTWRVG